MSIDAQTTTASLPNSDGWNDAAEEEASRAVDARRDASPAARGRRSIGGDREPHDRPRPLAALARRRPSRRSRRRRCRRRDARELLHEEDTRSSPSRSSRRSRSRCRAPPDRTRVSTALTSTSARASGPIRQRSRTDVAAVRGLGVAPRRRTRRVARALSIMTSPPTASCLNSRRAVRSCRTCRSSSTPATAARRRRAAPARRARRDDFLERRCRAARPARRRRGRLR